MAAVPAVDMRDYVNRLHSFVGIEWNYPDMDTAEAAYYGFYCVNPTTIKCAFCTASISDQGLNSRWVTAFVEYLHGTECPMRGISRNNVFRMVQQGKKKIQK